MPRKLKYQRKTTKRKNHQKGGVGYTLTNCRVGGLSEVSAVSECPQNVGPGSPDFAKALYSAPILFSGTQAGGARYRKSRSQKKKKY